MNLYSEEEIKEMLLKNGIQKPEIFINQLTSVQDSRSNELLLSTASTILAGILSHEGVSSDNKNDQVEDSLKYTHLLIQKIDKNG